ncbi:MAG: EAL domain-containing response regulator [Pseudomonadota bacterium]
MLNTVDHTCLGPNLKAATTEAPLHPQARPVRAEAGAQCYKTVLVVDDDPLLLAVCKAFFKRRQAENVLTATSALEALGLIQDHPEIDLVLCDLNMPDVDGLQFLRILAEQAFSTPIIIISGEDGTILRSAHALAKAQGLAMLGKIAKPINHSELEDVLEQSAEPTIGQQPSRQTPITEQEFREALTKGEIRAHLQPVVECESGQVVSAEALARWNHPVHGPILPDAFVPPLEQAGLIPELTEHILTDALATKVACKSAGYDLQIAVNTDAYTISQLDFPDRISAIAASAGVRNSDIKLELTERNLIDDGPGSMEVLTRLRLRRFAISIDDFGTGNSNLQQLCTFPLTELKIDKAFLDGVATDRAKAVCLNAIVSLARSLNLQTVAEGIETEHDMMLVSEAGVKYAQGHHIAKPLDPDAFLRWLQARDPRGLRLRRA